MIDKLLVENLDYTLCDSELRGRTLAVNAVRARGDRNDRRARA
jgi:hypothetical protein